MTGPNRKKLVEKILSELENHPNGVWIRKLARILEEPVMTVHKYVTRKDYVGRHIKLKKLPKERGGHIIVSLKDVSLELKEEFEEIEPKDLKKEADESDYYIC